MSDNGLLGRSRRPLRVAALSLIAAAVVMLVALPCARPATPTPLASATSTPTAQGGLNLTVSIISPANGGGAAGQTLQAGAFAIVNSSSATVSIASITIAFSHPSIFSSAALTLATGGVALLNNTHGPDARFDVHYGSVTLASGQPSSSTTFTFSNPFQIAPGAEPVFALMVKMAASVSRKDTPSVTYAGIVSPSPGGAGAPLWIALTMLGLAMAALPGGTRRRVMIIASLMILLALGAPGCGSDSSSGPSSTQSVAAVTVPPPSKSPWVSSPFSAPFAYSINVSGLPLSLGVVTWE